MVVLLDSDIDTANAVNVGGRKKYIPHRSPFDPWRSVKVRIVLSAWCIYFD